jgi:hypothetical protein
MVLVACPAHAHPIGATVVLLQIDIEHARVSDAEPWQEGEQAAIAELEAAGFRLELRTARAQQAADLPRELEAQLRRAHVSGAVVVFRRGARGIAWVHDRRGGALAVETEVSGGTVSTSRFVLQVVELLRQVDIGAMSDTEVSNTDLAPEPATREAAPHTEETASLRFWLGGGATVAAGLSSALPSLTGSWSLGVRPNLAIESTVAVTPWSASARMDAGRVHLRAQELLGFLMFDPMANRAYGVAFGLGGGALWAHADATAAAGFVAYERTARVALLATRVRAFAAWRSWYAALTLDPGVVVPPLEVSASGQEERLRIGRPWASVAAGIGGSL